MQARVRIRGRPQGRSGNDECVVASMLLAREDLRVGAAPYQKWHNTLFDKSKAGNWELLDEDGKMGDKTRAQLIGDYMNMDGTTLPASIRVICHGCGEAFPLPEPKTGCAWERFSTMRDRRVEFFFFDESTGVTPEPVSATSSPGSLEYPAWLAKAEIEDLTTEAGLKEVTFVEMHDALFRTNSAVVLPEGEDPTNKQGGSRALTSVGLFATVLRYNEEHPSHIDANGNEIRKKLLIAGHTDTKGKDSFNQPLSEERAKVTLALLTGGTQGRDDFAKLCLARHDGIDLTQIFHWVADSPDFEFQCKPTVWDQVPSVTTVTHFKQEYNKHFDEKFKDIPGAKPLKPENGTQDLAMWAAIFDCYEYGLRCELGDMETTKEGKDELDRLRKLLTWVDDKHQSMGFGERFPVDEVTKNEFRSQSNRRVEVMMFDDKEEPDIAAAVADPEVMETYLPGEYAKKPVPPMVSARPWKAEWEKKIDPTTGKELPARDDEERTMSLVAPGLPAGTPVVWEVFQFAKGAETSVATQSSVSETDSASDTYVKWFEPEAVVGDDSGKLPKVSFHFTVTAGGRLVKAKLLEYGDEISIVFVHDLNNEPVAKASYCIHSPWGYLDGTTTDKGEAIADRLPPGGVRVVVRDYQRIHTIGS